MRLLLLVDAVVEDATGDPDCPQNAIGVVRTQVRLQKLDFWLRYPDYLANELLSEFEAHPDDVGLLRLASEILDSEEPDLRRLPMLRGRFGAFEQFDTAMSVLVERGLVATRARLGERRIVRHDYYLLVAGRDVARSLVDDAPTLNWYRDRTHLLVSLVDGLGGTGLKTRQYLQREYADTPLNSYIPPITDRARERLERVRQLLAERAARVPGSSE